MSDPIVGNYLRSYRRKAGLSQHDVSQLVGYKKSWQISRHERSRTAPPLLIALTYEVIYRVPVSALFNGFHATVAHAVEKNISNFEKEVQERGAKGHRLDATARKLQWLAARKNSI